MNQVCNACGKQADQSPLRIGRVCATCTAPVQGRWVESHTPVRKNKRKRKTKE